MGFRCHATGLCRGLPNGTPVQSLNGIPLLAGDTTRENLFLRQVVVGGRKEAARHARMGLQRTRRLNVYGVVAVT